MGQLLRIEKWAENLEEATLSCWLKAEGDRLSPGDPLCEIITDKATFEFEMEFGGLLRRVYAAEKSVLPVGYAIAFVGEAEEPLPDGVAEENDRLLQEHQAARELVLDLPVAAVTSGRAQVRATPAARRVAREGGVELGAVAAWMGESRRIGEEDVRAYLNRRAEE